MRHVATRAAGPLRGEVRVPGDKSVSHRAVLFAAMARGVSHLTGVLDSADVRSTLAAVHALGAGVGISEAGGGSLDVTVSGWGATGPTEPDAEIDCGNSGTTARLLMGVLAGWPVCVTLTGDESLSRRPMGRVTVPLSAMGAEIVTAAGGRMPVRIFGGGLHALDHESQVASAQVKTAVLLAGLRASGRTVVSEPVLSRDHTERLLPAFGIEVGRDEDLHVCWVEGPAVPIAADVAVPRDPSSAAFMVGAATVVPASDVVVCDVALNPTRLGFLRVLARMGADVEARTTGAAGAEPVGDIVVHGGTALRGVLVAADESPSLIDEVPLLAVVAARAEGTTRFEGVRELRVKESDRLTAVADGLRAMGVSVRTGDDWLEVDGVAELHAAELDSLGDHRLAMTYAVAALAADGPVGIERFESVGVSYPGFLADLAALGGGGSR
ncbi:MAG: 3-phosphoshikimate 1-carboxyvinyltransferase [Actinobacteria bacterium]|nr:MAG: 3-phosphoshikimate 1-carboxyvinyltransferase [Actinomycetota bacterium]